MRCVTLLCCCCTLLAAQQQPDTITISLKGLKAPMGYLGYFVGDQTLVIDSVPMDIHSGTAVFNQKSLVPGMYFFATEEGRYFNFMVDHHPVRFEIQGEWPPSGDLRAVNSPENSAYFSYQRFVRDKQNQYAKIRDSYDMLLKIRTDPEAKQAQEEKMRAISMELNDSLNGFVTAHPRQLFAQMLTATQFPQAPAEIPSTDGLGNPNLAQLQWINRHYWSNNNFSDERLLRNPAWASFLDAYIDRFTAPDPDSVIGSIDRLLARMPRGQAYFQFTVKRLTQAFETSEWPPSDHVFVHMVDRWFPKDSTPWLDDATLLRLEAKADIHRPNLTGQPAPTLALSTADDTPFRLDTFQATQTLLIFYSPLCPHCMEAMPDIYQTYLDARPYGLRAVAVNTDENFTNWKKFLAESSWDWVNAADPSGKNEFIEPFAAYNLPVLYLLDKNKNILRKRIRPEDLRQVLEQTLKQ
ncbi:MAG: DUF5106 domain-containing protein [Lewinellaceae bacterium]|nr:DUF5106 domain-containing protein [Lewinellaceae bacterium]